MGVDVDKIAETCHEINRVYCEGIGDISQPKWKDAPEWQRESARKGVLFRMTNRNAGPSNSHENWLKDKIADGWVWGEVKDPELKTHPCIRPYRQLPKEQQVKDDLFCTLVKLLA